MLEVTPQVLAEQVHDALDFAVVGILTSLVRRHQGFFDARDFGVHRPAGLSDVPLRVECAIGSEHRQSRLLLRNVLRGVELE